MAALMAAVAAVPHRTPFLSAPTGCGESFDSTANSVFVILFSVALGTKMDCNQSSVVLCVGVVRGVGTMAGVGVTDAMGSIEPNTLTTAV